MTRQLAAFLLIALMAAIVAGLIAWRLYHGHERTYRRRRSREEEVRRRRLESLEAPPAGPDAGGGGRW